jgi:hypothetical protein
MVSFSQASPPTPCAHLSPPPYAPSVGIYNMLIAEGLSDVRRTYKPALRTFSSVHFPMQLLLISLFLCSEL